MMAEEKSELEIFGQPQFGAYELANVNCDSDLRRLLMATGNRSFLVIEDIDCSEDLPERRNDDAPKRGRVAPKEKIEEVATLHVNTLWTTLMGIAVKSDLKEKEKTDVVTADWEGEIQRKRSRIT
ncbi:hypothetical protein Patl1_14957 [Pistacia atlantica]|uniref:Uncharacterized protein n=1 Tax=Pistacia atlantica TaxID=434234 RepID=A0ACC1B977_9ROSI|nr:hypothetical protein Patl1_14957 [Pistacia atlantica]